MLRFANAAAAVSCTRYGAMDGIPTLEDGAAALARPRFRLTEHRGLSAPDVPAARLSETGGWPNALAFGMSSK